MPALHLVPIRVTPRPERAQTAKNRSRADCLYGKEDAQDEGSGADIGRYAVIDALHGRMPAEVRDHVFPAGMSMPEVVKELYRGSSPQAWLASFTAPIAGLAQHAYVQELVRSRFNALTDRLCAYFPPEQRSSITATGSVAFGLADTLRSVLAERGMQLIDVHRSPMPGLLKYRSAALL